MLEGIGPTLPRIFLEWASDVSTLRVIREGPIRVLLNLKNCVTLQIHVTCDLRSGDAVRVGSCQRKGQSFQARSRLFHSRVGVEQSAPIDFQISWYDPK